MITYQEKYYKYKNKYFLLKQNILNNSIYLNQTGGFSNTLILIKADWCGHCKAFKHIWEQLPLQINNINFKVLDSDKDAKLIEKYNIKGFPSIFLQTKNKLIEYNGFRDIESIKNFVDNN